MKRYLSEENRKAVEQQGFGVVDDSGDLDTPLAKDGECAYVTHRDGILKCAYECAYLDGKFRGESPPRATSIQSEWARLDLTRPSNLTVGTFAIAHSSKARGRACRVTNSSKAHSQMCLEKFFTVNCAK